MVNLRSWLLLFVATCSFSKALAEDPDVIYSVSSSATETAWVNSSLVQPPITYSKTSDSHQFRGTLKVQQAPSTGLLEGSVDNRISGEGGKLKFLNTVWLKYSHFGGWPMFISDIASGSFVVPYVLGLPGTPYRFSLKIAQKSSTNVNETTIGWAAPGWYYYHRPWDGNKEYIVEGVTSGETIIYNGRVYSVARPSTSMDMRASYGNTGPGQGPFVVEQFGRTEFAFAVERVAPKLVIDPAPIEIPAIEIGKTSVGQLAIKNAGNVPLEAKLQLPSQSPFTFKSKNRVLSISLAAKTGLYVPIYFSPVKTRMYKEPMLVESNDPGRNSFSVDVLAATKATVHLYVKAFIPKEGVGAEQLPDPFSAEVGLPFPTGAPIGWFLTDNRSFSDSISASSRVRLLGSVEMLGYNKISLASRINSDFTGFLLRSTNSMFTAQEKPSGKFYDPKQVSDRLFYLSYEGKGINPFTNYVDPIGFDIDFYGKVSINFRTGEVATQGFVDDFPSYEMSLALGPWESALTQNLWTFTAVPPVENLFGKASNRRSGRKFID